jgi:hypothetical protein
MKKIICLLILLQVGVASLFAGANHTYRTNAKAAAFGVLRPNFNNLKALKRLHQAL